MTMRAAASETISKNRMLFPFIFPTWRSVTFIGFPGVLFSGHPLAVTGSVVLPMADSADYVPRRAGTHVSQKSRVVSAPGKIHLNAFGSVPLVLWAVRVVATLFDFRPRNVCPVSRLPGFLAAFGRTMRDQVAIVPVAGTTTLGYPCSKRPRFDQSFCSTFASTLPKRARSFRRAGVGNYAPISEFQAGQVDRHGSWHHPILSVFS